MTTLQRAYQNLCHPLKRLYGEREAANISDWVFERITGYTKSDRIVHKDSELTDEQLGLADKYLNELLLYRPVQYVLHEAWFAGMPLYVNEHVLIPRPETEELAEWVINTYKDKAGDLKLLDIGTGSGCIAIAVKKKLPEMNVQGTDVSGRSLDVATHNAKEQNLAVEFSLIDILEEEDWEKLEVYDCIVSNPPYVRNKEKMSMSKNVVIHEPHTALFVPDEDPLLFYKSIAQFGKEHLKPGGYLFFEINEEFGKEVSVLLDKAGYSQVELKKDLQGKDRMVRAVR